MSLREPNAAPEDTRLGWLQRGRGAGALALLEGGGRDAGGELIACIVDDPRVDRQVEERAPYYAVLVRAVDAPIEPIEERLVEVAAAGAPDASDAWLPLGVLAELARRGDARAEAFLRGEAHPEALRELVRGYLHPDLPRAPSSLVERARERHAALQGEPTERLVGIALGPPCADRRAALRLLGARDHAALVPQAVARLGAEPPAADPTEWRVFLGYLEELPGHRVLPLARDWLDAVGPLAHAAELLLARHAEDADRARVHQKAETALGAGEGGIYSLCSMIDALARAPHPAEVPLLAAIIAQTTYSYARARAIRALASFPAEPGAGALLREALWDCEPSSREIACGATQANMPGVAERLRALAGDTFEEDSVRQAARGRGD